jgi:hypothetical protein
MLVSHEPEQRFDQNGVELLQVRGRVVDDRLTHPEVVIRFAGQHRAQLARWATPGKHLVVIGQLEVKSHTASNGAVRMFLLVEASDIHPLNPDEVNHAREGVYAALGRTAQVDGKPRKMTRAERAETMRRMVADA